MYRQRTGGLSYLEANTLLHKRDVWTFCRKDAPCDLVLENDFPLLWIPFRRKNSDVLFTTS